VILIRRAAKRSALALATTLSLAASAYGHPPYEIPHKTFTTPSGREIQVVRSYIDGIMGTDPAKLILREASGRVLAETDYLPSIVLSCPSLRSCLAFEYDPQDSMLPTRVLRIRESGFEVETPSTRLLLLGAILPVWEYLFLLLVSCLALAAIPMAAQLLATRPRSPLIIGAWIVLALGTLPWLFFWLLGIGLNLPVAAVWVLAGSVFLSLLPFLLRRWSRRGLTTR
jgi:hypothetical protein